MVVIAAPPAPSDPAPAVPLSAASAPAAHAHPADSAPVRPRFRRLVVFTGRLP
jgi:hypothetical protein